MLDGDLTNKIKYTLDRAVSASAPGTYQVEFRVMDSAGSTSYLTTELEVYDPAEERVQVELSSYLVYLQVNDAFNPNDYFKSSSPEGDLNIQSTVDTSKAGTYYADYWGHGGQSFGKEPPCSSSEINEGRNVGKRWNSGKKM